MKKLFVLTLVLLLSIVLLKAQNTVTPVGESSSSDGIYYSLPQTVLKVHLKVKRVDYYAGPLASYADEYFGKENVQVEDNSEYSIVEISISDYSIPDADQYYYVQFKPQDLKRSRELVMSLNKAGVLSSVNDNKTFVNTPTQQVTLINEHAKINKDDLFDFVAVSPQATIVDTVVRIITVDTSNVKELTFNTRVEQKTNEELAKEVSEKIEKILHDRYFISIGYQEVAYPAGTMQYMDSQLKKRQDEYTALFLGKKVTDYEEYTFSVIPKKGEGDFSEVFCRFSKHSGVRAANSSLGEPLSINISSINTTAKMAWHAESVLKAPKESKGIYYRIPEYANVEVLYMEEKIFSDIRLMPQFGVVSFVPYAEDMQIEIHPETGAIKSVHLKHTH